MGKRLIIKGASFFNNAIDRISPSTTYYSVLYNLSHCSASNSATSIAAGSTYEVTITAQSGYTLSSVTVRHNGQTVNPISGNTYRINSVAGNITVTATATADVTTYTVTYDLVNATSSNNNTTVAAGSSYTVTLTPNSGYVIDSAEVLHNGDAVTPTSGYTYVINSVAGNILVDCAAVLDLPKTITENDWYYYLEDTCYLATQTSDTSINYFKSGTSAAGAGFAIIDVEIYRGKTITINNTGSIGMKTGMFTNALVPTNIPNIMGVDKNTATIVTSMFATGWSQRGTVDGGTTVSYVIPSNAKWFYHSYMANGDYLTYTMTIDES